MGAEFIVNTVSLDGAHHACDIWKSQLKLRPQGPCLIEVGARLSGGDLPHYARLGIGESQLDWMVDACLRPERFTARCAATTPSRRSRTWRASTRCGS